VDPPKTIASSISRYPDRTWSHGHVAVLEHKAATADSDAENVGHAEIGTDAGHVHFSGGLTWKPVGEYTHVTARAADIDDRAVLQA